MATTTTNYNLKKPATTDNVSIADINGNMDIIDAQIKANADAIEGKQDPIVAGTGISIASDGKTINHSNSITARTSYLGGSTTVPMIKIDAQGHITAYSATTIYPPTSSGTAEQIWTSDGSGQGVWKSKDTAPVSGSTNAITSGAVHTALQEKQDKITLSTSEPSGGSDGDLWFVYE